MIGASHLSWHFDAERTRRLEASTAIRSIGALRLAWLRTNEWRGERTAADLRSSPEPYLIVLMPLKGTIVLHAKSHSVEVRKHELGIWDSTQPIAFDLEEPRFEQLSVLVPQRMLRAMPEACAAQHCVRIDQNNVLSQLCIQHMATLAQFLDGELKPYELSLSTLTTSLFDAVIASIHKSPRDRERLQDDIRDYIECYITEESLSAQTIAAALEISPRYVHKLFEPLGCSVRAWIIKRRLERSADDLASGTTTVTEIAFKWGFKDLGHYSRAFHQRFGVPPSSYRKTIEKHAKS